MFLKQCNIDKTDRINRALIGTLIFFAALIGLSKMFFMVLGIVLLVEGLIGWCSIPYIISKIKRR